MRIKLITLKKKIVFSKMDGTTVETNQLMKGEDNQNHLLDPEKAIPVCKREKRNSKNEQEPLEKRKKTEKRPLNGRFDLLAHFAKIDKSRHVRCKNENCQKKTFTFCIKCKVHLCLLEERNCFLDFHTIRTDETKNVDNDTNSNE